MCTYFTFFCFAVLYGYVIDARAEQNWIVLRHTARTSWEQSVRSQNISTAYPPPPGSLNIYIVLCSCSKFTTPALRVRSLVGCFLLLPFLSVIQSPRATFKSRPVTHKIPLKWIVSIIKAMLSFGLITLFTSVSFINTYFARICSLNLRSFKMRYHGNRFGCSTRIRLCGSYVTYKFSNFS